MNQPSDPTLRTDGQANIRFRLWMLGTRDIPTIFEMAFFFVPITF